VLKKPTEYLTQRYFDALVFTTAPLRHRLAQVGASQVVVGTHHPIPWKQHPVDDAIATDRLSGADKASILGANAAKLPGIAV
jgi:hypothetical protein